QTLGVHEPGKTCSFRVHDREDDPSFAVTVNLDLVAAPAENIDRGHEDVSLALATCGTPATGRPVAGPPALLAPAGLTPHRSPDRHVLLSATSAVRSNRCHGGRKQVRPALGGHNQNAFHSFSQGKKRLAPCSVRMKRSTLAPKSASCRPLTSRAMTMYLMAMGKLGKLSTICTSLFTPLGAVTVTGFFLPTYWTMAASEDRSPRPTLLCVTAPAGKPLVTHDP